MAKFSADNPPPSRKGKPNKQTAELRGLIEQALANKGGVAYLERLADDHPQAFASLLGKILPRDVNANVTGGVTINWPLPKPNLDG